LAKFSGFELLYDGHSAWFAILVVFATLTFQPTVHCQKPTEYADSDAFDVYTVFVRRQIGEKAILVVDATKKPERCSLKAESVADTDFREAIEDFQHTNEQVWTLSKEFRSSVKADLIDSQELKSYFSKSADKGWKRFHRAHPEASGIVTFSAVGFNQKHTAAVVFTEIASCSECGVGSLHFLRKEAAGWSEIKSGFPTCGWIA
jgi:hypothetical protein